VGHGEQTIESVAVWPIHRQPNDDPSRSAGDPGGQSDQVPADRACPCPGMEPAGQASGGAGKVVRDRRAGQPRRIGGKPQSTDAQSWMGVSK
jgi:hypothetical protein